MRPTIVLFLVLSSTPMLALIPEFVRGDANNDTFMDGSDPTYIGNWLFRGGPAPVCRDAADANDDGQINIADISYLNSFLFQGGPAPPAPFPNCGSDPTNDSLPCVDSWCF